MLEIRHIIKGMEHSVATIRPTNSTLYDIDLYIQLSTMKVITLSALVAVALARPENTASYSYSASTPSLASAKYDFNYVVNDPPSSNDFGHQEARDGPNTQGSYFVLLPDSRLQSVNYNVNVDSGYLAEVSYEGEAQYPSTPRPYKPASQNA
ncbi:pro-resilin-like [Penaeus chinensis]|uniref:pro-resilin-like n=1 Tax=Penaeus chinensis TaxID=139456 RepID=UPI001FB7ABF1|nr:pro-resilin-like [Penaeus chinensis]